MSSYYRQIRHRSADPKQLLRERLARKEMGAAAYDKAASFADDRAFKVFGILFIAVFGLAVLAVIWLGY